MAKVVLDLSKCLLLYYRNVSLRFVGTKIFTETLKVTQNYKLCFRYSTQKLISKLLSLIQKESSKIVPKSSCPEFSQKFQKMELLLWYSLIFGKAIGLLVATVETPTQCDLKINLYGNTIASLQNICILL